jgi:hypothetical protein
MANSVESRTLEFKAAGVNTFKGTLHSRGESKLNNMLLFAKLTQDTGSAKVDIYVRSKSPMGNALVPLFMDAVLNSDDPNDVFYEMKEYPVRISDSNAVRIVYEAANIDAAFEVTVIFKTSSASVLRIEMPEEA